MTTLYLQLQEAIAERARLDDVIGALRNDHVSAERTITDILSKRERVQDKLSQFRSRNEGFDQRPDQRKQNEAVSDLLNELSGINADHQSAVALRDDLSRRLRDLEAEAKAPLIATPGDYDVMRTHQAAVTAAAALTSRLEDLVAEQDRTLAAATFNDPRPELARQRGDLLAAVAMGDATAADLEAFDKTNAAPIKAATVKAERHATETGDIAEARAGLARKLAETRRQLDKLNALTPQIRAAILTADLVGAHRDLATASENHEKARGRVVGLSELLRRHGARVPAGPTPPAEIVVDRVMKAERDRLTAAGIPLI